MSAPDYSLPGSNLGRQPCAIVTARWGAGAQPGKYHVYLSGDVLRGPLPLYLSRNCVVDDFGTLVEVQ